MGEAYRWMAGWVAQVERTGVVVSLMESVGAQQMREIEERVRAARARPGLFGVGGAVARREAEAVDDGVEMWEVEEEGGGYYGSDADY
jgi:hypothetical protein